MVYPLCYCLLPQILLSALLLRLAMVTKEPPEESERTTTPETPYLIDSSTFSSEASNDFGKFRFNSSRETDSVIKFTNDDRTVEWMGASKIIWYPIQTETKLHSGKWSLEFHVEDIGIWQIGVGFLLDWNIGPDWGFFGYLGSSTSAWSYDPWTGDIVTATKSIHGNLPKFQGKSGVIELELDLPRQERGSFAFIVDGVRTPTKPLPNTGAVAIPAVCLLSQGQRVTIRNLKRIDEHTLYQSA